MRQKKRSKPVNLLREIVARVHLRRHRSELSKLRGGHFLRHLPTHVCPFRNQKKRQCNLQGYLHLPHFQLPLHLFLSLIHISEPTRLGMISYAVFCLKKKKNTTKNTI